MEVSIVRKPLWEQTKLERAASIAEAFEPVYRIMWTCLWPHGSCMVSSLMLVPAIRGSLEWDCRVAIGTAARGRPHAWIESPEGDIIDPTYGQFDGKEPLRVLSATNAGDLGHKRALLLTIMEESLYRNGIKPSETATSGWDPRVEIMTLFGPNPHVSPILGQPAP